jgi:hypothetical protein
MTTALRLKGYLNNQQQVNTQVNVGLTVEDFDVPEGVEVKNEV